jgi:hypothetical protein
MSYQRQMLNYGHKAATSRSLGIIWQVPKSML